MNSRVVQGRVLESEMIDRLVQQAFCNDQLTMAVSNWDARHATSCTFMASMLKLAILKGLYVRIFRFYVEQGNKIKVHFFQVVLQLQMH